MRQDAVAEFQAASEANDPARLMDILAPEAELISPLLARGVIRGKADLRQLFSAVYSSLSELHWTNAALADGRVLMVAEARVGPFKIGDAMILELDSEGRIVRMRPHLRPWLATTWFAVVVGLRLARHPGVIWRAARNS